MESATSVEKLPVELSNALRLELDPGEALRWCGRPDPGRVFRSVLPLSLLMALFFGGLGVGALVGSVRTYMELRGLVSPSMEKAGWGSLAMFAVIGAGMLGVGIVSLGFPFRERRGALRTVYAVTSTRIMVLLLDRNGRARTNVVEPSHPLHLSRREHARGIGTIYVYPRAQGTNNGSAAGASLTLVGVQNPREVERTIRLTFDPPGTR
jgi:hypothetical protein